MARIFISHSSGNDAAALALAKWLEGEGWSDFFLDFDAARGIAPGDRWVAALRGAVDRCEAVLFLVSPAWLASKYCFAEFFEAKALGKRMFGIIVESVSLEQLPPQMTAEWQVCDLSNDTDAVSITVAKPPRLLETRVRFPRAGLEALAIGLRRAGLDATTFPWPPKDEPGRSPYPGLRALEAQDAGVFFGRDASIVLALDRVRRVCDRNLERLLVILGASGAGKSSFLRAGLLPRLDRDTDHYVVMPVIRPEQTAISGAHGLLASLKEALEHIGESCSLSQVRSQLIADGLASLLYKIGQVAASQRTQGKQLSRTVLVPIDQAEELLSSDGGAEAREFLDHLTQLSRELQNPGLPNPALSLRVLFLFTLRSDSLPVFQTEAPIQALSPVLFSLPPIAPTEFKAVIEGPARRHSEGAKSLTVSPALAEQLILDARGADALPLLALTLEWLYREFTNQDGTRLGVDEYERIGGVRGVINVAVARALERPGSEPAIPSDPHEQSLLLRRTFPYIATVDPDTGEWKRRIAIQSELPQSTVALMHRLVEQRVLRSDVSRMNAEPHRMETVEVAHEALLRQWDLLESWLRELGGALAESEIIRKAANDWVRSGRDEVLLVHAGHRLDSADELLKDSRLEGRFGPADREYLAACRTRTQQQEAERETQLAEIERRQAEIARQQAERAKLQRRSKWGLVFATLILAGLGVWIVAQVRGVSRQTSLVLAAAAENAADRRLFDQSMRLAVLAAESSWLHPAHDTAAPALARAADGSTLRLFLRCSVAVTSVGFSSDGHRLLAAADTTVRVWDPETGQPVGEPMEHQAKVESATFSPNARRILTVTDQAVRVWDADTGRSINPLGTPGDKVNSASFDPDSRRVVIASNNAAQIWDVDTPRRIGRPMRHAEIIFSATFSPDGRRVLTASSDKTARIWDAETQQPVGEVMKHQSSVERATFSPDGRRIVTTDMPLFEFDNNVAPDDNLVRVWDAETGHPIGVPMKLPMIIASAIFSPDSRHIVTTTMLANNARIWDAETGQPTGEPLVQSDVVRSARFSPDSRRVLTASNSSAMLWDVGTGNLVGLPMASESGFDFADFSPDGAHVVTTSFDGVRIWDIDTSKVIGQPIKDSNVEIADFSSDDQHVVITSEDATTRVWDTETGKPVSEPVRHKKIFGSERYSPDGRRHIIPVPSGAYVDGGAFLELSHGEQVTTGSFSPDGRRVITISGQVQSHDFQPSNPNIARIWNAASGRLIGKPMIHEKAIESVSFSPDSRLLVTASKDGSAQVWDAGTARPVGERMHHGVMSARFSPDGRRVVTTSRDSFARIWDAQTGKPVSDTMRHDAPVSTARFSPDGRRVVTASGASIVAARMTMEKLSAAMNSDEDIVRVWDAYWPSLARDPMLTTLVCRNKLHGDTRRISEADIRAVPLISKKLGMDVCESTPNALRSAAE